MPSVTAVAAASDPSSSSVVPTSLLSLASSPATKLAANQGTRPDSPLPPSADSKPQPVPALGPAAATDTAAAAASTASASSSPPGTADSELEEELQRRLRHRRLELDYEIEEFKLQQERQYQRFAQSLRAAYNTKRKKRAAAAAAAASSSPAEPVVSIDPLSPRDNNSPVGQLPAHASTSPRTPPEEKLLGVKSPPFEKELQVAGLFAPCYLPLLEDRRGGEHGPLSSLPTTAPTTATMGVDAAIAAASSHTSSPTAPLPSSLKSSNSFDSQGRSDKKPKSPKKVTFQFEDESTVPSRSSPPPTKATWNFGTIDDGDDADYEEAEEVDCAERSHDMVMEHLRAQVGLKDRPPIRHEERAVPASVFGSGGLNGLGDFSRYQGDELVTPTAAGLGLGADHYNGMGASNATIGSYRKDLTTGSWTSQLTPGNLNGDMRTIDNDDDDDDEGLFDLDETVPDAPPQTPPHRDLSPLIEAQLAAQQIPPEASEINIAASYAPRVPPPSSTHSFTKEPFTFGKFQIPAPATTLSAFTNPFGSSLAQSSLQINGRSAATMAPQVPVASSLPATTTWGFTANRDVGHFRRRSINKYIPSPPPEDETERSTPEPEAMPARSPFGTSVPMAITPRLSSLRSPPASTSPLNKPSTVIPEEEPPSSDPPLTFYVDPSADALAASPPPLHGSSEVDSYRKTARFPSASMTGGLISPYRTRFAQELAQQALLDGEDPSESIVGGVDGRTGLDPESFSVHGRASSFASPSANLRNATWSLSARLAVEEEMEASGRR